MFLELQEKMVEGGFVEKTLNLISDREDIAWQAMGTLRNLVIKNGLNFNQKLLQKI